MPKKAEPNIITEAEAGVFAAAYKRLDEQKKLATKEQEKIKEKLRSFVSQKGHVNAKGSSAIDVKIGTLTFTLENRKSVVVALYPDAIQTAKKYLKGDTRLAQLVETTEVLRDDVLRLMIENGELNDKAEMLKDIYSIENRYSFYCIEKKPE